MAKNVVIFGAGASHGAGAPLMADFVDAVHSVKDGTDSELSRGAFETVTSFLGGPAAGLHAKSTLDLDNMEVLFGLLEMGELLGRLPGVPAEDIQALAADFRTVLAETIESTCLFEYLGMEGWQAHQEYADFTQLISKSGPDSSRSSWALITFNYDVALDFALYQHGFEVDYGFQRLRPIIREGTIPLLKLHGSVNWAQSGDGRDLQAVGFAEYLENRRPGTNGKYSWKMSRSAIGKIPGGRVAIAPPSWNKSLYHRAFVEVWKRAAAELAEAESISIVGYSAPATDGFFRDLLALAMQGAGRLKDFQVVNPDQDVQDRLKGMLGPQTSKRFREKRSYFRDYLTEWKHR